MSLRWRLFLSVGILFILAFVASIFYEDHLAESTLIQASQKLENEFSVTIEKKREKIQKFLEVVIAQNQAEIDVLLQRVAQHPEVEENFIREGSDRGTWFYAANFLMFNKWIDFIQNTNGGEVSSLIIPNPGKEKPSLRIPVQEGIFWVEVENEPYLGIEISLVYSKAEEQKFGVESANYPPQFYKNVVLFNPRDLRFFTKQWKESAFEEAVHIFPYVSMSAAKNFRRAFKLFVERVMVAKSYIQQSPKDEHEFALWIEKEVKEKQTAIEGKEKDLISCDITDSTFVNDDFVHAIHRDNQVAMIWILASLYATDAFGPGKAGKEMPIGMAEFEQERYDGKGFLAKDVFFSNILFKDSAYYKANEPKIACWDIGGSIAVIGSSEMARVFIGNTLKLSPKDQSYLTIGIDGDELMQHLVLATQEEGILIHYGEVVSAYSKEGQKLDIKTWSEFPIDHMAKHDRGIVTINGSKMYYLKMTPIDAVDLHFVIFSPLHEEFSFVDKLQSVGEVVLKSMAIHMRVISLVALVVTLLILELIARKISRPITALATAAGKVSKGEFDDIQIPEGKAKKHDEIQFLCNEFKMMVQGLQEKNKLKGVLDKVVSSEIAEEILKGNVALGGEEKDVTVFFADIRGFTHMTQSMEPSVVIEMLNNCMTRITRLIEEEHGVIDKFVGDEIMALFGAPVPIDNSIASSLRSALRIIKALNKWNRERQEQNQPLIEMGIGIHTGKVIAGNMGAEDRLNYTVLGANVNLASRLCSAAKKMEILVSEAIYNTPGIQDQFTFQKLEPIELKGFSEKVPIYALTGVKR